MIPLERYSIRNGWLALLPLWLSGCQVDLPETSNVLIAIGILLMALGGLVVIHMRQRAAWHKATQRKMRRTREKARREAELNMREVEQRARKEMARRTREVQQRAKHQVEQQIQEIQSKSKKELEEKVLHARETARQDVVRAVQDTRQTARREVEEKVREAEERIRGEMQRAAATEEALDEMPPPLPPDLGEDEEEDLKATLDFQPLPEQVQAMAEAEQRAEEQEQLAAEQEQLAEEQERLALDEADRAAYEAERLAREEQRALAETMRRSEGAPPAASHEPELVERLVREETEHKAEESVRRQAHKAAVQKVQAQFQRRHTERMRLESTPIEAKPTTVWPPPEGEADPTPAPAEPAPAIEPQHTPPPAESAAAPEAPMQRQPGDLPEIILAEDSNTMRKIFTMVLAGEPCTLITVPSGREALEKARLVQPALMIADLSMDDDGYYVCREMKADPLLAEIPVLLLHSQLNPVDEDRAGAVGADGDIEKPFDSVDLLEKVRNYL